MFATCLLDSSIIIDVLNGKRGRRELIDQLIRNGAEMAWCSINVTEIYAGLKPGEWEIAKKAGELQNEWRQQGRTLSLPDVTIAAVALANELTLITGNTGDFPMKALQIHPVS